MKFVCSKCRSKGHYIGEDEVFNEDKDEFITVSVKYHCDECDNVCNDCADEDTVCIAKSPNPESEYKCPTCFGQGDASQEDSLGGQIDGDVECDLCNGTGTVSEEEWKMYRDMK